MSVGAPSSKCEAVSDGIPAQQPPVSSFLLACESLPKLNQSKVLSLGTDWSTCLVWCLCVLLQGRFQFHAKKYAHLVFSSVLLNLLFATISSHLVRLLWYFCLGLGHLKIYFSAFVILLTSAECTCTWMAIAQIAFKATSVSQHFSWVCNTWRSYFYAYAPWKGWGHSSITWSMLHK